MMKETYLQVNTTDFPEVERLVRTMPLKVEWDYLEIRSYTKEIIDNVFYPIPKTKLVYTVPQGKVIFCLLNNFSRHKELFILLQANNVKVDLVPLTFL